MGTLSEFAQKILAKKLGQERLANHFDKIEKIWTEIKQSIEGLALDYQKTRIYQDGLPLCGRELEIVTDLARMGSINHQIILELKEKGATLMGTERPDLLVEEYQLLKNSLTACDSAKQPLDPIKLKVLNESILKKRDEYIANRINTTLAKGEIAVLFLGILHSLESMLDDDINVIYPIDVRLQQGSKSNITKGDDYYVKGKRQR